jgi:hypothetical protein
MIHIYIEIQTRVRTQEYVKTRIPETIQKRNQFLHAIHEEILEDKTVVF